MPKHTISTGPEGGEFSRPSDRSKLLAFNEITARDNEDPTKMALVFVAVKQGLAQDEKEKQVWSVIKQALLNDEVNRKNNVGQYIHYAGSAVGTGLYNAGAAVGSGLYNTGAYVGSGIASTGRSIGNSIYSGLSYLGSGLKRSYQGAKANIKQAYNATRTGLAQDYQNQINNPDSAYRAATGTVPPAYRQFIEGGRAISGGRKHKKSKRRTPKHRK
jgi:hypothetical protein